MAPGPSPLSGPSETSPLLPPPAQAVDVTESPEDDDDPVEAKDPKSLYRWLAFWAAFTGLTVFLVVEAFKQGGGEFDWMGALKKAGGGGISGAAAMVIQVLTLMPLRTMMNYQYRFGGTFFSSYTTLKSEGFGRFYAGLGPALFQGPIARFGDTAANAGILALLASNPFLSKLPRVSLLRERIRKHGISTLWYGALATAAASFVGSFPWFATYNYLSGALPPPTSLLTKLLRQAFIGFVASVVSDTVSNSLRVLKTYRQVHQRKVGYRTAAREIIAQDGVVGLFGRGLGTRLLANGLQGLIFSVLWRLFQDLLAGKPE
ncbi:hypothetical protein RQP46_006374 [Phenoliferia psychrophenolica]